MVWMLDDSLSSSKSAFFVPQEDLAVLNYERIRIMLYSVERKPGILVTPTGKVFQVIVTFKPWWNNVHCDGVLYVADSFKNCSSS